MCKSESAKGIRRLAGRSQRSGLGNTASKYHPKMYLNPNFFYVGIDAATMNKNKPKKTLLSSSLWHFRLRSFTWRSARHYSQPLIHDVSPPYKSSNSGLLVCVNFCFCIIWYHHYSNIIVLRLFPNPFLVPSPHSSGTLDICVVHFSQKYNAS